MTARLGRSDIAAHRPCAVPPEAALTFPTQSMRTASVSREASPRRVHNRLTHNVIKPRSSPNPRRRLSLTGRSSSATDTTR